MKLQHINPRKSNEMTPKRMLLALIILQFLTLPATASGTSDFVTKWNVSNGEIAFRINTGGTTIHYDISGATNTSGSFSQASLGTVTISGLTNGSNTLRITSPITNFSLNGLTSTQKQTITEVSQWGTANEWAAQGLVNAFNGCTNVDVTATDVPDLSKATSLQSLFEGCSQLVNANGSIGNWNTGNVTNMNSTFRDASGFNQHIGSWNTSKVTNMSQLFRGASAFNQNIGSWNTGAVTNMVGMFREAGTFDQNIGSWNTEKVTNMSSMFRNATSFHQNIGSWNTAAVTNMGFMFQNATVFNQPIGAWNTAAVTDMSFMFRDAIAFNQDIGSWNTGAVTDMSFMFRNASAFHQNIGSWNTINVVNMSHMFNGAIAFNQNIGSWNTGKVTDMSFMFRNATVFNQNIGLWNTAMVTDMSFMFRDVSAFNQDIGLWNTAMVTNMNDMFRDATSFNQDLSKWCVSNIASIPENFDQSAIAWTEDAATRPQWGTCPGSFVTKWNVSNGEIAFRINTGGTTIHYDISGATNTSGSFSQASLGTVTISGLTNGSNTLRITSPITNFSLNGLTNPQKQTITEVSQWGTANEWAAEGLVNAFNGCTNLDVTATDVPDLSKATSLRSLFEGCSQLVNANGSIGNWNTGNVTNMNSMFRGATVFNQNIGSWNTGNVTNMSVMFLFATAFNQNIGSWNTEKVTDMSLMFRGASAFNQNISSWNTELVEDMSGMFNGASAFNQNISSWNTGKVTIMSSMFDGATAFNQDLSKWCVSNFESEPYFFDVGASAWAGGSATRPQWGTCPGSFVTKWNVSNGEIAFRINTEGATIHYDISGATNTSGSFSQASLGTVTISGLTNGSNTLRITSPITNFSLNGLTTTQKQTITEVSQWGTANEWAAQGLVNAFNGCTNVDVTATDVPDLSKATSLQSLFEGCSQLVNANGSIGNWNTGNVTNMNSTFRDASGFNQHIGSWNTSKVTNMSQLFRGASAFNQNIGSWNTGAVTNMVGMFREAGTFDQNIGSWNTEKVTNMSSMFRNATSFHQNIGSWNTAAVTNMGFMFQNATVFNQPIGAWNTAAVTDMSFMFRDAIAFNQDIGSWNTGAVTDMSFMFRNASAFHQNIGSWNTINVVNMSHMFNGAIAFNQNIGSWNTGKVTDMSFMFRNATVFNQNIGLWNTAMVTDMSFMFRDVSAFNQDIGLWNTAMVTNMNDMFRDATSFNQDLSKWCVSNIASIPENFDQSAIAWTEDAATRPQWGTCPGSFVTKWNVSNGAIAFRINTGGTTIHYDISGATNTSGSFSQASLGTVTISGLTNGSNTLRITSPITNFSLNGLTTTQKQTITEVSQWGTANEWAAQGLVRAFNGCTNVDVTATDVPDLSKVSSLQSLFEGCSQLVNTNGSLGSWNTEKVTNMISMFRLATAFNQNIGLWNTEKVTNMSSMFSEATAFNQNISSWNTELVEDMSGMFQGATAFNQNISSWNTEKVTNMRSMFSDATAFNQHIGTWNTSKVTLMDYMFYKAAAFNQNIGSWNTREVINMSGMFFAATAFNQNIGSWNTEKVTNMSSMFQQATAFNQNIGSWNTEKVTNMSSMFQQATAFNQNISSWNTGKVTIMSGMFYQATAFNQNISLWNTEKVTNMNLMLRDATSFNQDLSIWCVSNIATKPILFDQGATSWPDDVATRPQWGTCPTPPPATAPDFVTIWNTDGITSLQFELGNNNVPTPYYWEEVGNASNNGTGTFSATNSNWFTITGLPNSSGAKIRLAISPQITQFRVSHTQNRLLEVAQWGDAQWRANGLEGAFNSCSEMNVTATDAPNLSNVTSLSRIFVGCRKLVGSNLGDWNVSTVQNMTSVFHGCHLFNSNITSWNTSNVTSMFRMFFDAKTFNQNISSWNVGKVTNMNDMFNTAEFFNQDLSSWCVENIATKPSGFNNNTWRWNKTNTQPRWGSSCSALPDEASAPAQAFVTIWNTDGITSLQFELGNNNVPTPYYWEEVGNASNNGTGTFSATNSNWFTITGLPNSSGAKIRLAISPQITQFRVSHTQNRLLEVAQWGDAQWRANGLVSAFNSCSEMNVTATDAPNLSNVTSLSQIFVGCRKLVGSNLGDWNVSTVQNMTSVFHGCHLFNSNITSWNTSNVTSMFRMFFDAKTFNQNISSWNVGKVTNMNDLFNTAEFFNQDLSSWCVDNIAAKPSGFDNNTWRWNKTNRQPVWGTCPPPPQAFRDFMEDDIAKDDKLNIVVYPNPSNGTINVKVSDKNSYAYRLIDMQGKMIRNGIINGTNTIDNLAAGMYKLIIVSNAEQHVTSIIVH
jgi:surface protein